MENGKKNFRSLIVILAALSLLLAFAMNAFADEADFVEEPSGEVTSSEEPSSEEPSSEDPSSEESTSDDDEPEDDPVMITMGDINGDFGVDISEARKVLRASVGMDSLTANEAVYADMNGSGDITTADARLILRIAVGLDTGVQHAFEATLDTAASCTEAGRVSYTCSVCESAGIIVLAKTPHAYETVEYTAPACLADGYKKEACTACSDVKESTLRQTGHKFNETGRVAASCEAAGNIDYTCSACSATKSEPIAAIGHNYQIASKVDPTCTTSGTMNTRCENCGLTNSLPIKELGHQWVRCTATNPQTCSRCNEKATGWQQASTGKYYYYSKSGNTYTCAKNQIVGSYYVGPDGARVDDDAIQAAVDFVNTYTSSSASNYNRMQTCYNYLYQYFDYKTNPDIYGPSASTIPSYCTQMFREGGGNCLRFASAMAYIARVLGFDSGFAFGQISASGGGTTEHAVTEIYYGGTTYVCDAMMQTKYPSTNTFMVTYNTYPYGYSRTYYLRMTVANGEVTWA